MDEQKIKWLGDEFVALPKFRRKNTFDANKASLRFIKSEVDRLRLMLSEKRSVDDRYELIAGALSVDPKIAKKTAELCLISENRSYEDFQIMAEEESKKENGIEVVTIATPPHLHFKIAKAFLSKGISVICEKPITKNLSEAIELKEIVEKSECLFAIGDDL